MTDAHDAGFSLVEVLIAVVIMGICFAGLLSGMGMSVLASDIHRSQADGQALLVSAAEAVKDEGRNPFVCPAGVATYDPSRGVTAPPGWAVSSSPSVSDVDVAALSYAYWSGSGYTTTTSCTAADLQQITLSVTSPDGKADESLTVLKRRP